MIHNTTLHKTAFITGGAKRIGKAISQTLHADGFNVIVITVNMMPKIYAKNSIRFAQIQPSVLVVIWQL